MLAETPQNGEYLVAAYVTGAVILVGYWLRLAGRARRLSRGTGERPSR